MQKKETWRDLRRRARWDRLIGAGAVLFLLIILIISSISSCAKKNKTPAEPVVLETDLPETQPTTEEIIDNSKAVFLSPSTQEDNRYACDSTVSEEDAMWIVARKVKQMLENDGITVYICGEDDSVPAKVKQGNHLKCGAYVAIHSNSSGESGTGQGTECFYNTEISGSLALAESVYNRVAEVTPTDDRGLKDQYQRDLYEIFNNISPCCLVEVEFHDNLTTSRWILNHTDDLAQAIADGIEAYLENAQYSSSNLTDVTEPSIDENYAGDH
ncbi:MAG: N-acetylmuramoyl-L-alanine amidase [Oscillospiraceae bacterium]|nr:N-acetylmuramoyl-L-alanine amidase [Oscillospiraceae bacterium]